MRKTYLSPNAHDVSPLESCVLGNGPAQFGKGATEKGRKAPRRCPTSFGKGELETCRIRTSLDVLERHDLRETPCRADS
jgi:hypothetical protein